MKTLQRYLYNKKLSFSLKCKLSKMDHQLKLITESNKVGKVDLKEICTHRIFLNALELLQAFRKYYAI